MVQLRQQGRRISDGQELNYGTESKIKWESEYRDRQKKLSTKCAKAHALAYPDGQSIPKMKYWLGNYIQTSGQVTGSCVVNKESPDLEGKAYFSFIRPENNSAYYLHSFFDNSEKLTRSIGLLNFSPPTMWTYHDSSVTNADITPQLTNFSCIKEEDLLNSINK